VDPVEPHAVRFGAVGIVIGQRTEVAAVIPFLARDRAGVAADADVEIDHQPELFFRWRGQARHACRSARVATTSLSCSARLPGARVTFSCLAKRKSPLARRERARTPKAARRAEGRMPGVKRRPPREHVLSTSMCSGCACGRRGSPTAHPCAGCELARILRAILRTFPSSARRVRGAPFGAHDSPHPCGLRFGPLAVFASAVLPMQSACVTNEAVCLTLLRTRPGWPASKQSFFWGPC